jgi:Leucine-rich repeat (LRR) protein
MLQYCNLHQNQIQDLEPLQGHENISFLDISNNLVQDKEMLVVLNSLKLLCTLQMDSNPIELLPKETWVPESYFPHHPTATYPPSYRLSIIHTIQRLTVLNSIPVTAEERVAAINCYNPPTEVSISIQHINHQQLQSQVFARIKAEDLLRAKRLIPIVLCGPNGVGKRYYELI